MTLLDPQTAEYEKTLAAQLTPREMEVLGLLTMGYTSDRLATHLAISPNTVRTHVGSILVKLGTHSRLEAAAFAFRHDLFGRPGWL